MTNEEVQTEARWLTLDQIQLAAHQLGMYLADIDTAEGLAQWRAHNRAASELRERVGATYQPYAFPNKALVKAAYNTLHEEKSYKDFGAMLSCVRGKYLSDGA
jgi:hypothetical protein